jgi:hypothetical protein
MALITLVMLCDVSAVHNHGKRSRDWQYKPIAYFIKGKLIAPEIGVGTAVTGKSVLRKDRYSFKDSNGNGLLEPYED